MTIKLFGQHEQREIYTERERQREMQRESGRYREREKGFHSVC